VFLTLPVNKQVKLEVYEYIGYFFCIKMTLYGIKNENGDIIKEFITDKKQAETTARNKEFELSHKNKEYKSSHWDESNILAHVRLNERTLPNGERVLFIEEVQSDWAQDGKKKGFKEDKSLKGVEPKLLEDNKKTNIKRWSWDAIGSPVIYFDGDIKGDKYSVDYFERGNKKFKIFKTFKESLDFSQNVDISQSNAVPQMPYKKKEQWIGRAMRRVMQMASQEGFDRIAWVTG